VLFEFEDNAVVLAYSLENAVTVQEPMVEDGYFSLRFRIICAVNVNYQFIVHAVFTSLLMFHIIRLFDIVYVNDTYDSFINRGTEASWKCRAAMARA